MTITAGGLLNIITMGSGKNILVINGGPGFSHFYMKSPLEFISADHRLCFYDQPGCGQNKNIIADLHNSAEHLNRLIKELSESNQIIILAHSWGSTLFMAALALGGVAEKIEKAILVNPMPWTRDLYEKAREQFISSIPVEVLEKFGKSLTDNRPGAELMECLLPYYTPEPIPVTGEIFELESATWQSVNDSLGDFNYGEAFNTLTKAHIILGEKDFITKDLFSTLINGRTEITVMDAVGHMPFYEKPEEFRTIMNSIL